jgi:hypothetical protein
LFYKSSVVPVNREIVVFPGLGPEIARQAGKPEQKD